MTSKRDLVNWNPSQRADMGDMNALSRNLQYDHRRQLEGFLYGKNDGTLKRIIDGFNVSPTDPVSSEVEVTLGVAIGAEVQADATLDYGVVFGDDTVAQRNLDFGALAVGVYSVWLRFSADLGEAGTRVVYNAGTNLEEAATVYTRKVHDWDTQISAASPGAEWQLLAIVDWDGATVQTADITEARHFFFEGDSNDSYNPEWGDGANDRSGARARYGVKSLWEFVQAVRRQLEDIIGDGGWWKVPAISLLDTKAHVDDASNPHGNTLTQANLVITSSLERSGADTLYLNIPAASCAPAGNWSASAPTIPYTYEVSSAGNYVNVDGSGIYTTWRGVHMLDLPKDALIKTLSIYFTPTGTSGFTAEAYINKVNLVTGSVDTVASVSAIGGVALTFQVATTTGIDETVNNQTHMYVLVILGDNENGGELKLHAARISYQKTKFD